MTPMISWLWSEIKRFKPLLSLLLQVLAKRLSISKLELEYLESSQVWCSSVPKPSMQLSARL